MIAPAIEGPMSRAALNIDELSAIAFARSSRSVMTVLRNACRAGMSKAFTSPWTAFRAITAGTVMCPVKVRSARANDCTIDTVCVTTRMRWRSHRSRNAPANGPRMKPGSWPANPTIPRRMADPVSGRRANWSR